LDPFAGNLSAVVAGDISGGNGRFEGATGTWQATVEAEAAAFEFNPLFNITFRLTGTIVYDLD
jgi:hypothetical protein